MSDKVDFNGIERVIRVNPGVTTLDIRQDVYTSWVDWVVLDDNLKFKPALRTTGMDPIGGGAYTGDIYFLINGWKLYVDLTQVRVTGVLFSDDYESAYFTPTGIQQYPATVAALVNTVSIGGGGAPTADQNAAAVWSYPTTAPYGADTFGGKVKTLDTTLPDTFPISVGDKSDIAARVWNQPSDTVYDQGSFGEYFKSWFSSKLLTVAKFLALS